MIYAYMNKFTLLLHQKGWTVKDACGHWRITPQTYHKHVNNESLHNRLWAMCKGLETKEDENNRKSQQ